MSQSITVPVSDECEHRDCSGDPAFAYVVTGESGKDGVAVYCKQHSQNFADPSVSHTALAEVSTSEVKP